MGAGDKRGRGWHGTITLMRGVLHHVRERPGSASDGPQRSGTWCVVRRGTWVAIAAVALVVASPFVLTAPLPSGNLREVTDRLAPEGYETVSDVSIEPRRLVCLGDNACPSAHVLWTFRTPSPPMSCRPGSTTRATRQRWTETAQQAIAQRPEPLPDGTSRFLRRRRGRLQTQCTCRSHSRSDSVPKRSTQQLGGSLVDS